MSNNTNSKTQEWEQLIRKINKSFTIYDTRK